MTSKLEKQLIIQQLSCTTREIDLGWLNGQPLVQGKGQKMATLVIQGKEEVKQEVIVCSMRDCEDTRVVFGLITKLGVVRMCSKCVRVNFNLQS